MSTLHLLLATLFAAFTTAQDNQNASFDLAPIASAAPQSTTFALAVDKSCDSSVVTTVYELYAMNTMVFQTCVSDGQYKIFPYSGTPPTTQQIGAMARSLACRSLFTSILMAGIPTCELTNFPIRAAAETLLKIGVDIDKYPTSNDVVPTTDRFVKMLQWRRDVNLAQAASLPCDSESKLYAEYSSNLYTVTTNGLVRLTADKEVQYRTTLDGSFSQEHIVSMPDMPGFHGSGSDGGKITTVNAVEATVKPCAASTASSGAAITHAELKAMQSTDAPQNTKTSTSDAASTSAIARVDWKWSTVAAIAIILAALM